MTSCKEEQGRRKLDLQSEQKELADGYTKIFDKYKALGLEEEPEVKIS